MKKLLCACFLITICLSSIGQNVPSYVPTNGLVGWWPFNGNANDESGNGNNGTVNGATLTTDRFGSVNKAFIFNSSNSEYISINGNLVGNGAASISGWFYATTPIGGPIFHIGSDNSTPNICNGYFLGFGNNANPTGNTLLIDASCNGSYNTGWNANANNWYHFILIRNQNTLTVYINGNIVGIHSPNSINPPSNNIFFGATYFSNSVFFNGKLDDIAIYNRILTQQEITNLYNASTSAPAPCSTLPANLQTGLVGYWPFCGNANDESGNGNNGTVNGATLTSDRFGNAGKAYIFDGVNDWIGINSTVGNFQASDFAISCWILDTTVSSTGEEGGSAIVAKRNSPGYGNFFRMGWLNAPSYDINESSSSDLVFYQSNLNLTGMWNNYLFMRNSNKLSIYINGTLFDTRTTPIVHNINNDAVLSFGARFANAGLGQFYKGKLDDICIWNRALDSTEITQLYQTQGSNSSQGNVGINVVAPQRSLHVKDAIRLEPRNTPLENPVRGDMYYDGTLNKLRVYDGTTWQNCW